MRSSSGGGCSTQFDRVPAQLRGHVAHPVLEPGQLVGPRHERWRIGDLRARAGSRGTRPSAMRSGRSPWVTVTRRVDDRSGRRAPGRPPAPAAASGVPASTKYACREWGSLPDTVALAARRACATVCPPKTRSKRPGSPTTRKRSSPDALELERVEQAVEREEDGPLERSVAVARGRHRLGGLGCHRDMASTRRHVGCLSRPRRL